MIIYSQHNNTKIFDAICVDMCNKCPWNNKRAVRFRCLCEKYTCNFYIHASQLREGETMQINTCNLEHRCRNKHHTRKLTSKFLAFRYLEVWRRYLE